MRLSTLAIHNVNIGFGLQMASAILVLGHFFSPPTLGDDRNSQSSRLGDRFSRSSENDSSHAVAQRIDELVAAELNRAEIPPAQLARDEDFLRRVTFDITGTSPSPTDVTLFGLDPNPKKRTQLIDRLLDSPEYAGYWARYWSDVIFLRASNARAGIARQPFTEWMTGQLSENISWNRIAKELITAKGDVNEDGRTAILFAHEGSPSEIAAEVSRIFLGIQIQCANCHDHPTDDWKREQFHELAAFFPRVGVRRQPEGELRDWEVISVDRQRRQSSRGAMFAEDPGRFVRMLDRNRDGKLNEFEVRNSPLRSRFSNMLERNDSDNDGALSLKEFENIRRPPNNRPGQGSAEYYMPDLSNPTSPGTLINPVFFATNSRPRPGMTDLERRNSLANYLTASTNPWFAKAFVNRIWAELVGEAFYTPIDDMGPQRQPNHAEVLELLSQGFVDRRYDIKWLIRTIANTRVYQRATASLDGAIDGQELAAVEPVRLRADQIYDSLTSILGVNRLAGRGKRAQQTSGGGRPQSPRTAFSAIFGFDPSTPNDEILGNIPQALFMMNSPLINNMIRASGRTRLARLLRDYPDDGNAIDELYLLVLSREATAEEKSICLEYIDEVGGRNEAFEDLLWSLLNSSEFLSKR